MNEIWRSVIGDDKYEVSSFGRVRRKGGRVLTPFVVKSTGYLQVNLSNRSRRSVHRLVAMAFLDNPDGLPQVNHKNGRRKENHINNLEWVSAKENIGHAYESLGRKGSMKGRFSGRHSTSKAIFSIDMATGAITRYESAMDAVRVGFDSSSISRCCNGLSAHHKGRYWRFAHEAKND